MIILRQILGSKIYPDWGSNHSLPVHIQLSCLWATMIWWYFFKVRLLKWVRIKIFWPGLGLVSNLWIWKISLQISQFFQKNSLRIKKKSHLVGSKKCRSKMGHPLVYCGSKVKSMLGSGQGPSLPFNASKKNVLALTETA